jgi:hypothetical protein
VQKVAGGVFAPARSAASFGWRPTEAYLAGKKKDEKESDEGETRESEDTSEE